MTSTTVVTTPLIDDIERLVDGVPGWSPVDQLYTLATLVHASTDIPGDIVEVGAWCGRSTAGLAHAAAECGNAVVHAIDPFPAATDWYENVDGSFSFSLEIDGETLQGYSEQTVWAEPFRAQLAPVYQECRSTFEIFTRVLRERGLDRRVAVHRGTSKTFARAVGATFRCRMAFIDGDHGYDAVTQDIRILTPLLSPGAWICFDDAFSSYSGVNRAIGEHVIGSRFFTGGRQLTRKLFVARRTLEV